jgi:HEAT repeat protein
MLLKTMKSKDGSLAVVSAWAFTKIGPRTAKPAVAVPVLIACLSDALPETRRAAAEGLADMGPAARDAAPALKKVLTDPSKPVRESAAKALQAVNGSSSKKG